MFYIRTKGCFCFRVLCETVKDFSQKASELSLGQGDKDFSDKCQVLNNKLDLLLNSLHEESQTLKEQQVSCLTSLCFSWASAYNWTPHIEQINTLNK